MENIIEKQRVTFKGIFKRDGKFLLVKEDNNFWELPGGRLELGEEIGDCFTREIEEELGWTGVKMGKVIYIWERAGKISKIQYVVICVMAEPLDESIVLSHEHVEYGWFTLSEIEKLSIWPEYIETLKKI